MSMKPKQKPSFFKVLIMDFTRQLRVPPAFSVKYEQSLRGGNVKLRISSGRTWDVKVEKMEDEKYRFGRGWTKFAEDVGLEMGEFVVFRLVCRSLFEVSIYGVNGCEREITVNKFENEDDGDDDDDDHNAPDVINTKQYSKAWKGYACNSLGPEKGPLYFEIHLKKHQKSRLSLTKKFCTAAGLMGKETVCLVYLPKRHYQTVVLDYRPASYRVDMTAGWPEFRKANGLVTGKNYSFEFKPTKNVIQVQELLKAI